jgi:hypothetical protein
MSSNQIPIGLYVGNPDGNNAANMAAFKSRFDQFTAQMGRRPTSMNSFLDTSQDPSKWVSNAQWTAWSWAQSGDAYVGPNGGVLPVYGMHLSSNASGFANCDTFFQAIIAGQYDSVYSGIVDAWSGQGYKAVDFRLAYEFDGAFMPDDPDNSKAASAKADFIAAFRHVVGVLRAEAATKGVTIRIHWNPATINWNASDPHSAYPGDDVVDVISVDVYSPTYPTTLENWNADLSAAGTLAPDATTWAASTNNRRHFWQRENANQWNQQPTSGAGWSMDEAIAMAKAHGKPLSICECGAGGNGTNLGPVDEDQFAPWLLGALQAAQAQGVTVLFVNIWATDESDGKWGFLGGEQPNAALAWNKAFGEPVNKISATLNGQTIATTFLPVGSEASAGLIVQPWG